MSVNLQAAAQAIETLLKALGVENWSTDPNFKDTPKRVARMYAELLTPQENNWTTFPAATTDLIILRGHRVTALCPHHLLPVDILAYVGYIPRKATIGLSKLARVVEQHLTKPIMQEDLAHLIAESLWVRLEPQGVAVVLCGIHGCMRHRGVESDGDVVSSVMKGVFIQNPAARQEFLQLIGRP